MIVFIGDYCVSRGVGEVSGYIYVGGNMVLYVFEAFLLEKVEVKNL